MRVLARAAAWLSARCSALGVYDGSVYDALWERARGNGFNAASSEEQAVYKVCLAACADVRCVDRAQTHIRAILERGKNLAARL